MAKAVASDSIMAPDKMKPLLALSKHEPVQAAIGLTTEGDGVILLHKKAKPKKVMSLLRAEAGKAKLTLNNATVRFGRAEVDTDYDAGMVRFFINKDAPGNMRVKLVEVVKRIAYQKVEINVDSSLNDEPEEDGSGEDETEETAAADAPAPEASTTPAPDPATTPAPDPATTPTPAPTLDGAALSRELAALIGRIGPASGNDAGRKVQLAGLAGEANGKLKAGDLAAAADSIARLRDALDVPPKAAEPVATGLDADALRKELMGLAGRIAQAAGDDAARKARLAQMAGEGNGLLKAGNLAGTQEAIARLREALDDRGAPDTAASRGDRNAPPGRAGAPAQTGADAGIQTGIDAEPQGGTGATASWQAAAEAWRDANDATNDQINGLRTALLNRAKEGDGEMEGLAEALSEIADGGLNAITEDHRVKLMASVMEMGGGEPAAMQKFGAKALAMVQAFSAFLDGSEKIEVCDANPFGAPVSIRATLGPPLQQMAVALQAAVKPA